MPEPVGARPPSPLEAELLASRRRFVEFVAQRIDDPALAEDIVQEALLRAIGAVDRLRDQERLVPWFYRILRNAIVDAYRRRDTERRRTVPLPEEFMLADETDEDEQTLCECFRPLVASLRPEYAEIIDAVELGSETPATAAERLGITANNFKVRRHRARRALRARLEETCRVCADHGCLDCTCEAAAVRPKEL